MSSPSVSFCCLALVLAPSLAEPTGPTQRYVKDFLLPVMVTSYMVIPSSYVPKVHFAIEGILSLSAIQASSVLLGGIRISGNSLAARFC